MTENQTPQPLCSDIPRAARPLKGKALRSGTLAAFVVAAGVAVLGGTAFAYIHSTGTGSGSASTGSAVSVTISSATAANDLFPGKPGSVKFTLKNTNPFTANFTKVTAVVVSSDNEGACPASNITNAILPYSISTISVGSGQTTATQTITGLISMSSNAPSTCQGVGFTASLTLSGQSN